MPSTSFERFAGFLAVLVGLSVFFYAIAFIILQNALLSSLFLLLIGLLSSAPLVAVFYWLRETDRAFTTWGVLLGLIAATGSAIHGGYDLANAINPPTSPLPDFPSQIDPRGLLTFGFAGVALLVIAWLIGRGRQLPAGLSYLGYLAAVLLVILYLGRLIVLTPSNPLVFVPAVLNGFIVNPIWYIWLGIALWSGQRG